MGLSESEAEIWNAATESLLDIPFDQEPVAIFSSDLIDTPAELYDAIDSNRVAGWLTEDDYDRAMGFFGAMFETQHPAEIVSGLRCSKEPAGWLIHLAFPKSEEAKG